MKDEVDYKRLVDNYSDMIYRIARGYLKNDCDAEDIVQEVFIKYIKNEKKFIDNNHEKNWIIRVTLNMCNNEIKSARKKKSVLVNEIEKASFQTIQENKIYDIIYNLEKKYKTVFVLYYLQGLSTIEISKVLRISNVAVRTRLMRARNIIKKIVQEGEWL